MRIEIDLETEISKIDIKIENVLSSMFSFPDTVMGLEFLLREKLYLNLHTSPVVNFRDTFFHFKKIVDDRECFAKNKFNNCIYKDFYQYSIDIDNQISAIYEHLNRGLSDICNYTLSKTSEGLNQLINILENRNPYIPQIRKYMHLLRSKILDVRFNGAETKRTTTEVLKEIIDIINELLDFLVEKQLHVKFSDIMKRVDRKVNNRVIKSISSIKP